MSVSQSIPSPPPSQRPPVSRALDARDRLNQLADALLRSRDARLLSEFLRLRGVMRR